jgi:RimJ/RimL family protein N-acetyltransferase
MTFRLIPIGRDGRPEPALGALPEDIPAILEATADFHDRIGYEPPWIGYLALDGDAIVGGGGFGGPPQDGRVEIAYFTRHGLEGRGHATRTAAALIAVARQALPGVVVWAKTAPEPGRSPAILERLGFQRDGLVVDHEVGEAWAWRLG